MGSSFDDHRGDRTSLRDIVNALCPPNEPARPSNELARLINSLAPQKIGAQPRDPLSLNILAELAKTPPPKIEPLPSNSILAALSSPFPTDISALLPRVDPAHRRRTEWNDRLKHWERPATVSEEGTIERAQANVQSALAGNEWLCSQPVVVQPQGSYFNNTNVRTEADVDLRAQHPALFVQYHQNVFLPNIVHNNLGYSGFGLTFDQIFRRAREELTAALSGMFGRKNIVVGTKALRIRGITGSRAEVDVVPTVGYHWVYWDTRWNRYDILKGVAIFSASGHWTINFPDQHYANGVAKRVATGHQFKKVVRILKRLRSDMKDQGLLSANAPSFLVECLAYAVEDHYFLVETDDRYSRVCRVARRIKEILDDPVKAASITEINGIKPLFNTTQAWTYADALLFANAAVQYLGNG